MLVPQTDSAEKTVVGVAQGCQNALVTVAFAGYFTVFPSCKLLAKSIKTSKKM